MNFESYAQQSSMMDREETSGQIRKRAKYPTMPKTFCLERDALLARPAELFLSHPLTIYGTSVGSTPTVVIQPPAIKSLALVS